MVGSLLFLLGIALVSQIFHLNARPASGLLVWWLGIVAVPWLTRAKGAQFVSLVALLTWLGMEMNTKGSWIEIDDRHGAGFMVAYFFLGLAVWLFGLALRGTRWDAFAGLHEKWGFIILGGALYWLGFVRHFWRWAHADARWDQSGAWGLCLGLVAIAGVAAWRVSRREVKALLPWFALASVAMGGLIFAHDVHGGGWLWSAASWISLFAISIGMIRTGIETGREGWVNLGVVFIAVNIVTRYFDLFGTMLEGGVFFILTGALVLVLGIFLEKKRRSPLAALRKEGGA